MTDESGGGRVIASFSTSRQNRSCSGQREKSTSAGRRSLPYWRKILGPYRKCAGAVQWRECQVCPAGAFAIGRFGGSHWRLRRTRGSYGFCLGDSKILRCWKCQSRVVGEGSLGFGQQPTVCGRGWDIEVSGWSRAMKVARDTKAIGVDDSVRGSGIGGNLGGVKSNPSVQELGSVRGKRFHSQHGSGTLRTPEACRRMGSVGWGSGRSGMIQQ
jgi:hypothetical protein